MTRHNQQAGASGRHMWSRFGPGTLLALAGALAILASGWLTKGEPHGIDAGRIAYEADSSGRMRRVDVPSAASGPTPAGLWKPSPMFLAEHAAQLRLSSSQVRRIHTLSSAWQREKAVLERAMSDVSSELSADAARSGVSMATLRDRMEDYSGLSRQYDGRRAAYWMEAARVLSAAQRASLDRIAGREKAAGDHLR